MHLNLSWHRRGDSSSLDVTSDDLKSTRQSPSVQTRQILTGTRYRKPNAMAVCFMLAKGRIHAIGESYYDVVSVSERLGWQHPGPVMSESLSPLHRIPDVRI